MTRHDRDTNAAPPPDADAGSRSRGRRGRRLLTVVISVLALLLLAVYLTGPWLAAGVVKSRIAGAASNAISGEVRIDGVEVSWFGPQRLTGVALRDPSGDVVASLDAVSIDRTAFSLIAAPADLGEVVLDGARVTLAINEAGTSNLKRAVAKPGSVRASPSAAAAAPSPRSEAHAPPRVPEELDFRLVAAEPVVVDWSTPTDSGRLLMDLKADAVRPAEPATFTLTTTQADGGAGSAKSVEVVFSYERLIGDDGRLDLRRAQPALVVTGENAPPALAEIATALLPTARARLITPNDIDAREPISFSLGVKLDDGRLRLVDPERPAYIDVPITAALASTLLGETGAGLALDPPRRPARVTIEALDVPLAGAIAKALNWRLPHTELPSLADARLVARIDVPQLTGDLRLERDAADDETPADPAGDPDSPRARAAAASDGAPTDRFRLERVSIAATTFRVAADPIAAGASVRGSLRIAPRTGEPATVDIDLAAADLLDARGRFASIETVSLSGEVRIDGLALAAVQPFARGAELVELLGETVTLTARATTEAAGEPVELALDARTSGGVSLLAAVLFDEGVLTARDDTAADLRGIRFRDDRPSERLVAVAEMFLAEERVRLEPVVGADIRSLAQLDISAFRVPLTASQPLTETTAELSLRVEDVVLRAPRDGDLPPMFVEPGTDTRLDSDIRAFYDRGVLRIAPPAADGPSLIAIADAGALARGFGVPLAFDVRQPAAPPGVADAEPVARGDSVEGFVIVDFPGVLAISTAGERPLEIDLSADDPLQSFSTPIRLALRSDLRLQTLSDETPYAHRAHPVLPLLVISRPIVEIDPAAGADGSQVVARITNAAEARQTADTVAIDLTATLTRDALFRPGDAAITSFVPQLAGELRGLRLRTLGPFAPGLVEPLSAAAGASADVVFSPVSIGGDRGSLVELRTAADSALTAVLLPQPDALRVVNASGRVRLTPERLDDALLAFETEPSDWRDDRPAPADESINQATATSRVGLASPAAFAVELADLSVPARDGSLSLAGLQPLSLTARADGPVELAITDEDAPTGSRRLRIAGVVASTELPIGEQRGAAPAADDPSRSNSPISIRASAQLVDPMFADRTLADAELDLRLGEGPLVGILEISEGRPEAIDRWLGAAGDGPGPFAATLGERFALSAATSIASPGESDGGFVLRLDAERLDLNARLLAEREGERVVGYRLAEPVDAEFVFAPQLIDFLLVGSARGKAGADPQRLALDRLAMVRVSLDTLRLGSFDELFAADRFVIDAQLVADDLRILTPSVASDPDDSPGAATPLSPPVLIPRMTATLTRVPESRTDGDRGAGSTTVSPDLPLGFELRAFNNAADETFSIVGSARQGGQPDDGAAAVDSGPVLIDAAVRGSAPTRLADAIAGADGLLVLALGERADVQLNLTGVAADRSRGDIVGSLDTPRASASLAGRLDDGAFVSSGDPATAPSSLTVSRITNSFSERALAPLFPLLSSFEKTPTDRPLVLTATARGGRPLSLPLDGDLTKLDGALRVDLGSVTFASSDLLAEALRVTSNVQQGSIAGNIEPVTVTFDGGVARYRDLVIPWGDVTLTSSAVIDLPRRTMDVTVMVPLSELSADVERAVRDVPGGRRLASIPLRARGPIGEAKLELAPDLLAEALRRDVRGEAERAIDDALRKALDDIFNRDDE